LGEDNNDESTAAEISIVAAMETAGGGRSGDRPMIIDNI